MTDGNRLINPIETHEYKLSGHGLTKLEHFSISILQGMIASGKYSPSEYACREAVKGAKELINQLNEKDESEIKDN